jgi:Ca2+/Na+ antiporter
MQTNDEPEDLSIVRSLARNRLIWSGSILYGLYWFFTLVFPDLPLIEASSVLALMSALAICITWFPSFAFGVVKGGRTGGWQLPIGIWLTMFALSEQKLWTTIYRFSGEPGWMLNHHFTGQANWILFLATMFYILSPGNETGQIPLRNWKLLAVSIGFAGAAAGAVLTALILRPQ